jgi:hypothetical protein
MVSCSCNQPENWRYVLSNAHHWLGVCSRKREVERQRRDQRKREDMLRSEVDQSTRKLDSSLTSPTRTTASHDLPHQPQKEWRTCNTSPTQSYVVTNTGSNEHNDGSFSAEYTDESTSTRHDRPTDVLQLLRIKRPTASIATGLDGRAERLRQRGRWQHKRPRRISTVVFQTWFGLLRRAWHALHTPVPPRWLA